MSSLLTLLVSLRLDSSTRPVSLYSVLRSSSAAIDSMSPRPHSSAYSSTWAVGDLPHSPTSEHSNSAAAASSSPGHGLLPSDGSGSSQSRAAASKSGNFKAAFVELLPLIENRALVRCEIEPSAVARSSKGAKQGWNRN